MTNEATKLREPGAWDKREPPSSALEAAKAAQLERAARFLGEPYFFLHICEGENFVATDCPTGVRDLTDDELCMALLRRAADTFRRPYLRHNFEGWLCQMMGSGDLGIAHGTGPTPLAAVLAAVAALEGT